jgi:hypothetical protein
MLTGTHTLIHLVEMQRVPLSFEFGSYGYLSYSVEFSKS